MLKDFAHESLFLQNKEIRKYPETLVFMGFQDVFETVNPFGAAKVVKDLIGL